MSDITSKQILAAAQELAPRIRDMREELDATRHLPASLAKKMTRAGLFQLHACKELGGPELSPLTGFRVITWLRVPARPCPRRCCAIAPWCRCA